MPERAGRAAVGDRRAQPWEVGGAAARLAAEHRGVAELPILIGDSHDRDSLDALCAQTKVVCTCVGPYQQYGSALVAACAESGTHYCDLTGEAHWIRRMIDAHHAAAVGSGARVVHCAGFDSIPSDLGVFLLQEHAIAQHGRPCEEVVLYVTGDPGVDEWRDPGDDDDHGRGRGEGQAARQEDARSLPAASGRRAQRPEDEIAEGGGVRGGHGGLDGSVVHGGG